MLEAALKAEVNEVNTYVCCHCQEPDKNRYAPMMRNGRFQERTLQGTAGQPKLRVPRACDKRDGQPFASNILLSYPCKSPCLEEAVPVLYLRGLSIDDFQKALTALLGEEAIVGFSATTVACLLAVWQDTYKMWPQKGSWRGER